MLTSKISEQNKKSAGSLIPVRCHKITAVKKSQPHVKLSSQLTAPSEIKLQRNVTSLKSSKVSEKSSSFPTTNLQNVGKLRPIENLMTKVQQAKKVQPAPLKLNKSAKTVSVPFHRRNLSSVNKESKPPNVKKSQPQPEHLKLSNKPLNPVQRNVSSVNACSKEPRSCVKKSNSPVQLVTQKQTKNQDFKSQNNSKPFKNIGEGKHLKTRVQPKQSNKDEIDYGYKEEGFHRVDDKKLNAHNLPTYPSAMISNKENVDTIIVEEVKQITAKRKNKGKEDSSKIQSVHQKSEINEDLKVSKITESMLAQSVAEKKENKSSCSTKSAVVVSDTEFQNSNYFKSLILAEREESPGIIKLSTGSKVSSIDVLSKSTVKKFLPNYLTEEDFLEDLRRNSSNFLRRKGLSPVVPGMKSPAKKYLESFSSVNDFVEDLRRNSANLFKRRATLQGSPHLIGYQSPVKNLLGRPSSAKDIIEDLRRNSANFIKRREKLLISPFQTTPYSRRWTCNAQHSLVKRFPVVIEKTRFQTHKKIENSVCKNPENLFNFQPSALKGSETLNKKNKSKKKVTFYISPPPNSSESTSFCEESEKENIKTVLTQGSEQSSKNSTPEFEPNVFRNKENSVVSTSSVKTRNSSTPEFNLEALKILPSSFGSKLKNNEKEDIQSSFTPKLDENSVECSDDKKFYDPKCKKATFSCFQPISGSPSCKLNIIDFKTIKHPNSMHDKNEDCKNTVKENNHCSFPKAKSFAIEGQTAIIKPMQHLSISSNNNVSETKPFTVETVTPHYLSSYSNSYLLNSLSPPVLIDRSSVLASHAPICTPLVLKNVAQNSDLNPVRQKLDFEEVKLERRESQICLQDVPTFQKMNDFLCDQECCMLSLLSSETLVLNRNLSNPIANILSNGDEMHFVPLNFSETSISS